MLFRSVVVTEKDAVKLRGRWPDDAPEPLVAGLTVRWEHNGVALERALDEEGIPHNTALLGVYDFVPGRYRDRMRGWLAAAPSNGGLLFCHPGDRDESGVADAIAAARGAEAEYLGSTAFGDDLAGAGVILGSAWDDVTEMSTRG